jgi:hypothetical protein
MCDDKANKWFAREKGRIDMLNEQQQADLKMISEPNEWPNVIILPLVNREERNLPRCAFLVRGDGPNLYKKNMFELVGGPLLPQLADVPTTEFESFEAILEAGWEVD